MRQGIMWPLLLLFCCFFANPILAQETVFQEAETAYQANDYAKAVTLLSAALEDGYRSSGIYHNLGNAYYSLGDYPAALLNYRRAQQLNPRNLTIEQQIALLKANLGQASLESENNSLTTLAGSFTLNELAIFCFVMWCIFWILGSITIARPQMRGTLTPALAISALAFITGAGLMAINAYETRLQPAAVTMQESPVRSGPDERYPSLYTLSSASDLRITGEQTGWVRFTTDDGRTGWVTSDHIERVDTYSE